MSVEWWAAIFTHLTITVVSTVNFKRKQNTIQMLTIKTKRELGQKNIPHYQTQTLRFKIFSQYKYRFCYLGTAIDRDCSSCVKSTWLMVLCFAWGWNVKVWDFQKAPKLLSTSSTAAPSLTDLAMPSSAQFVVLGFVFSGESVTPLSTQIQQLSAEGQQKQTSAPTKLSKAIRRVMLTGEELKPGLLP